MSRSVRRQQNIGVVKSYMTEIMSKGFKFTLRDVQACCAPARNRRLFKKGEIFVENGIEFVSSDTILEKFKTGTFNHLTTLYAYKTLAN